MSFDWREYKNVAQWIHDNAVVSHLSEEACCRTAMSRAYYAAFQCVMGYAVERESFSESGRSDDHGRLLAHFRGKGGSRARIYTSLERLRDNRLLADYSSELMGDPRKSSESSILEAQKVFDTLDRMLGIT